MSNRNVDKGREAENAVARVLQLAGMLHAERRTKRGGTVELACHACDGLGRLCEHCDDGTKLVPADAGDITGVPGLVVQVKWSGYASLAHDLLRTDEQRRVARADVGLLVHKRRGVGCARAELWEAYLPQWQLAALFRVDPLDVAELGAADAVWHTNLGAAAALIASVYAR